MLTNNRIWRNRTVDIGVVTAEDALNYGFRWGRPPGRRGRPAQSLGFGNGAPALPRGEGA